MGRLFAIEVIYRGIFQSNLAKNITRGIVFAARREGKTGLAFGRYGDSPERNGIPAKRFAIVATDDETLQEGMAKYEPKEVDVTVVLDDTLCKGVESWAWYGLQPANELLKPGGTLIVTSMQGPERLLAMLHRKAAPYQLAILRGIPSFSGLWVYKDDHTDVRVLGAIARVLPELFSIESAEEAIRQEWRDEVKARSARRAYETLPLRPVTPEEGNPEEPFRFQLPRWWEMREGIAIPSIPRGSAFEDPETGKVGGFRPQRNATFKKYTTRTMRPVVDFDKCVKCAVCWLQCPDSVFDVTPDGYYDAFMEACCGCGVCEAVCPVEGCITMVNEVAFSDNRSQWQMWKENREAYRQWVQEKVQNRPERSHGFRYRGQYEEQLPAALEAAGVVGVAGSGSSE